MYFSSSMSLPLLVTGSVTATLEFAHKETWDPLDIWSEWCETKRQKYKKTKRQKDEKAKGHKDKETIREFTIVMSRQLRTLAVFWTCWVCIFFSSLQCFVSFLKHQPGRCLLAVFSLQFVVWFLKYQPDGCLPKQIGSNGQSLPLQHCSRGIINLVIKIHLTRQIHLVIQRCTQMKKTNFFGEAQTRKTVYLWFSEISIQFIFNFGINIHLPLYRATLRGSKSATSSNQPWARLSWKSWGFQQLEYPIPVHSLHPCVGHTASAWRREGRYQAGPKGSKVGPKGRNLKVGPQRGSYTSRYSIV